MILKHLMKATQERMKTLIIKTETQVTFSMKGLTILRDSPYNFINPIIDTGAPTSTGGTDEAANI